MKQTKFKNRILSGLIILCLSLLLRLWRLDEVPVSLTGDELAFSYNAWSIWQTGKDEYGISWPLTFKSFGDYKVPLPVYLQLLPVGIFGINEWSVRLPITIIASITPLLVFLLIKTLLTYSWKNPKYSLNISAQHSTIISFTASMMLVFSPWHIHFSRGGWEVTLGVFFGILGLYSLANYTNKLEVISKEKIIYFLISVISFSLGMYSYHASKVYIPLLIIAWFGTIFLDIFFAPRPLDYKNYKKHIFSVVIFISMFTVFSISALTSLTNITGNSRFVSSTVSKFLSSPTIIQQLKDPNIDSHFYQSRLIRWYFGTGDIFSKVYAYFSPAQIFVWGDKVERHSVVNMGRLLTLDFFLLLLGLIYFIKTKFTPLNFFAFLWVFIGALPGIITQDEYHTIRSLMMIVPIYIFVSLGLYKLYYYLNFRNRAYVLIPASVIYGFYYFFYFLNYQYITPIENAEFYQYGMKQVAQYIKQNEYKYDRIIVESPVLYGHPYIHIVSHMGYPPYLFQQTVKRGDNYSVVPPVAEVYGFGKIEFRNIDWRSDQYLSNSLFLGPRDSLPTPDRLPSEKQVYLDEINYPSGKLFMRIIEVK